MTFCRRLSGTGEHGSAWSPGHKGQCFVGYGLVAPAVLAVRSARYCRAGLVLDKNQVARLDRQFVESKVSI
jgi:hypothetical protein